MLCARRRIDRVPSRGFVRVAKPRPRRRVVSAAIVATPRASSPESVGLATLASTTVVSTRTLSRGTTLASAALASSVSFSASTVAGPQRVVIFISVVGWGTRSPSPMGQNRRQARLSLTSRHSVSKPSR